MVIMWNSQNNCFWAKISITLFLEPSLSSSPCSNYHSFLRVEQNVVFPSGCFDYKTNRAWKKPFQPEKILVKLKGYLYHNPLSHCTWTFPSCHHSWLSIYPLRASRLQLKIIASSPWHRHIGLLDKGQEQQGALCLLIRVPVCACLNTDTRRVTATAFCQAESMEELVFLLECTNLVADRIPFPWN